ncbi:hypothetical protein D3C85_289270 [compost metagenome]
MKLVARLDPHLLHPRLLQHQRGENAGLEVVADGHEDDVEIGQSQLGDRGLIGGIGHDDVVAQGCYLAGLALVDIDGQHLGILQLQLFTQCAAEQAEADDGELIVHSCFLNGLKGLLYSSGLSPNSTRVFRPGDLG